MIPVPPIWVLDTECYRDYFLIMLRNIYSGQSEIWEFVNENPFTPQALTNLQASLESKQLVTFNGNHYDVPLMRLAIAGNTPETLKKASDAIILEGMKPWELETMYGGVSLRLDHIDLIEVAPGMVGLKTYGGRLHSQKLQDLPIDPSASISVADRELLKQYCYNDLRTTIDLYNQLKPQLDLRTSMTAEFGIDLRSKSDAQIAEAVIRSQVEKLRGHRIYRPDIHPDYSFKYRIPDFISFSSEGMQKVLEIIKNATFTLNEKGSVELPSVFDSMRIRIGGGTYKMGIGGLHSTESCTSNLANNHIFIQDRDVTSYYPSIILNQELYPPHMGQDFLEVYRGIVERRIEAKRTGDKVTNEAMKIMINGSFGKFGSKWSVLYSPDLLIQVTLTGQLSLLMLIEWLEIQGFQVISANTDGIVTMGPKDKEWVFEAIVAGWEVVTGFNTEETNYRALYSKDVNNYIAIKPNNEVKLKGLYAPAGMQKNVTNQICVDAVIKYLVEGAALDQTILRCDDIRKFITIRQVKGGAKYNEEYLGKTVRWYYRAGEKRSIHYASNNNKVARSQGAAPLMELPNNMPSDIDYDWYLKEAISILHDVGGNYV